MFLAEKIFNIIDSKPKINYKIEDEKKLDKNIEGNISFKNVDFVYPAKLDAVVLKNINFSIKKGQTIGIVGTSGSGKSTIVNLMERLYDIEKTNDSDKGIFFDDINVKNFNLKNLHSQIGYVQQEPSLFNGTILDNITYGVENYSMEEINDVIYKSKSEFINDKKLFPKGLQTNVGERGSQLSGGQKQRIAIARALIKKPKILILDEATSALDSENEYKFQQELNMLNKDITIIIIAHRLSTIKNCDQIIVMNNGEIKQIGNHNKLIRTNGEYKHLMEQQISSGIIKN
jgi:ATP-binding cassette subfamily B (MDR/TAP) protein 1